MDDNITHDGKRLLKSIYTVPLIRKLAIKKGFEILENSVDGNFIRLNKNGKSLILCDMPLNINRASSARLCQDKLSCANMLDQLGYKIPKCKYFVRGYLKNIREDILNSIKNCEQELGTTYPLILKPNNLSQGTGVHKINRYEDAETAVDSILAIKPKVILLQECCIGKEYRVVVLGDEILQAYERIPLTIVGDGVLTIRQLLENKRVEFSLAERDRNINISDDRILKSIADNGYTMESVLSKNKRLPLQEIANLSLGGTSKDVTNSITPYFKKICIGITRDLGLDMCGIDIIADDLTDPRSRVYSVIEINSAPGLDNYLYADKSKQEEYVESLYEKVFDYRTKDIENNNDYTIE